MPEVMNVNTLVAYSNCTNKRVSKGRLVIIEFNRPLRVVKVTASVDRAKLCSGGT